MINCKVCIVKSFLAYPNLFGIKGFVVVVVVCNALVNRKDFFMSFFGFIFVCFSEDYITY
jgi:hypothetical protein